MKPHKNYSWTRVEEEKENRKTKQKKDYKVEMYTPKYRYFV